MRSDSKSVGQKRRSVIEDVRRAQIIDSAIGVLAESGYAGSSLSRIAGRAGISKGVISYHFAGKDDLMEQLVEQVYDRITAYVVPRVAAREAVADRIAERVRAVASYVRDHPDELRALTEVLNNLRDDDGLLRYGDAFNESIYRGLEAEFRAGREAGELCDFDVRVMAVTTQASIDAMIAYWHSYPDHDLEAHARELADLLIRAIGGRAAPRPREDEESP